MAKVKKTKWAIGADEPEDLAEFLSNDDIVIKHGMPEKGIYTFAVKRISVKPNKNGDDRLSVMLIIKEAKKSKAAKFNGYLVWDGFNVTDQGAPWIKRFLKGLGLEWSDFIGKTKQDDQDPPHIVQIGRVKFESGQDPTVRALVKVMPADDYNDDEHLEIVRYLPLEDEADEPEDEPEDDEDTEDTEDFGDDESDEDEDDDEEPDDDEEDEEDEEDDEDEEEALREELSTLKIAALQKRAVRLAKKAKVDADDLPAKKKPLIEWIVEQEMAGPPF